KNAITSDFDQMIDERYEMLRSKQISVACFHTPYEGHILFYEVLLCYLMGIRVVIENHTCFINALQQRGDITVNLDTYLLADKLVVLSRTDAVFWRSLGVNAQYIPNPCDYCIDDKKLKFDTPKEKNALVWVGRINNKYKKVYDLIPIMANVCRKIPDAKIYVVGTAQNSKELASFQKMIEDANLSKNIIICGFQQNVMQYYQKAVAMLMTSPGEGYPMVIIESKAKGIPTIMYDLPYLEVVKDGRGIITIEQGNIAEFADKIVEFLENTEMQEIMSNEARESFEQLRLYDFEQAWRNALESDKCEKISDEDVEKEKKLIAKLLKDTDYDYLVSN
nr:glycosyltransferase [Treponema sp.]